MSLLYTVDRGLFLFFNRTLSNPVLDFAMPYITESDYWRIPILVVWLALMIFGGKKGRIVALLVIIIITLSDQVSSSVIKSWVRRVRPCFEVDGVRLLIRQSRSFSFPSSHASNMSAMATLFSVKYPGYKYIFISIAVLVAYSRMYVGVHYPSDILGGAVLGISCAVAVLFIERWFSNLLNRRKSVQVDAYAPKQHPSIEAEKGK